MKNIKRTGIKLKETTICKLCLEPVQNFICINCLFSDITKWVFTKNAPEIESKIKTKHEYLKGFVSSDVGTFCIKCKKFVKEIACPCCYLYEIYDVIKDSDSKHAKEFEKFFNFDFTIHTGYSELNFWQEVHKMPTKNYIPIIISEKPQEVDLNFCESCGNKSDYLININGTWICETCREDINF